MNMIPVSSSGIASVGYEGTTMYIRFHSGGLYAYHNVPSSVYCSLNDTFQIGMLLLLSLILFTATKLLQKVFQFSTHFFKRTHIHIAATKPHTSPRKNLTIPPVINVAIMATISFNIIITIIPSLKNFLAFISFYVTQIVHVVESIIEIDFLIPAASFPTIDLPIPPSYCISILRNGLFDKSKCLPY